MTDGERENSHDVDYVESMLETAADLLERLAHELVATNERLVQLEARVEALGSNQAKDRDGSDL